MKQNKKIYPSSHVHNKQRFLRYKAQQTEAFVIFGHFLPFYPTNKPKNQHFEKVKKKHWRYYHFTLVYHEWQSWCLVPETWSSTGKIFSHFGLFFALSLKNQNFGVGDIIRLHLCTTIGNDMIYGSLDIKCKGQSFLWTIFCPFDRPSPRAPPFL